MVLEIESDKKNKKKIKKKICRITKGTKEWSDYSINFANGCSNDCRYCYAKKMAVRFGRKTDDTWKIMEIRKLDIKKKYNKRNGRFMFPTSHDITDDQQILEAALNVLNNLLDAGNSVLITTKPRIRVINEICNKFKEFKEKIQFRFTITTNNNKLYEFWEPSASLFKERVDSLKYAYSNGFKTSVSVEPFLSDPTDFISDIESYITESIWIGPMNYIKRNGLGNEEKSYYESIRKLNQPENLLIYYNKLKTHPKIRFKDSLQIRLYNAGLIDDIAE